MFDLYHLFLFLHIGGAIVAFGPSFTFPIIGAMGGREPQHAGFAARLTYRLAEGVTLPGAIFVGLMGIALIFTSPAKWSVTTLWLGLSIVLFVIALAISVFVSRPTAHAIVEATKNPPPPPAPGAPPPSGPPPHIAALVKRAQQAGMALTVLLVAITVLMVFKPGV
jgi:hypothetical protein